MLCQQRCADPSATRSTSLKRVQRATAIRTSARIALHQARGDERLRRGLLQRARTIKAIYEIQNPKPRPLLEPAQRSEESPLDWTGGHCRQTRLGVTRGTVQLTAPEHLRCAGPEALGDGPGRPTVFEETVGNDYREALNRATDGEDHVSDYEPSISSSRPRKFSGMNMCPTMPSSRSRTRTPKRSGFLFQPSAYFLAGGPIETRIGPPEAGQGPGAVGDARAGSS